MKRQQALTVLTKIKPECVEELKHLLDLIQKRSGSANAPIPFDQIRGTCFCSWIPLKADAANPTNDYERNHPVTYEPTLVFECTHEGDRKEYLEEFISKAGPALHEIYRRCEGYANEVHDDADLLKFLLDRTAKYSAFFVGYPWQSKDGILKAIAARDRIEKLLGVGQPKGEKPSAIHAALSKDLTGGNQSPFKHLITPLGPLHLRAFFSFCALAAPVAIPALWWVLRASFALFPILHPSWFPLSWDRIFIPWTIIVLAVVVFLLVWFALIRITEIRELARESRLPEPPPKKIDPRLFEDNQRLKQHHLTTLVELKPGRLRLHTMRSVLWLLNFLGRWIFITGQLGGLPSPTGHKGGLSTIHFARWLIIDTDKKIPRLLFLSNFDGSWHSYLGDFVDKGWFGLNAVWGNTAEFPATRYLFFSGAKHIVEFKQWSREHNCFENVWYSPYPQQTVKNILTNIRLAEHIGKPLNDKKAQQWLRLLG